jgi:hypothetical protein
MKMGTGPESVPQLRNREQAEFVNSKVLRCAGFFAHPHALGGVAVVVMKFSKHREADHIGASLHRSQFEDAALDFRALDVIATR